MWEGATYQIKLRILEAESTVMIDLLLEDSTLVVMVKRGDSHEACLAYVNENW